MTKELQNVENILQLYAFTNELGEEIKWTQGQKEIMAPIINLGMEGKRYIQVESPTRYGKSSAIAAAILMRCTRKESWAIVAGTSEKAQIIMGYFIDYALENTLPRGLLKVEVSLDKLKQERSRRHLSFSSGFEVKVFSADSRNKQSTGNAVMGFGCLLEGEKLMTDKGELDIKDVVERRLDVKILSYDHTKKKTEFCDILDYQKNPRGERRIVEIETEKGNIKCTEDHPVFVEGKGYIAANDLREGDLIWRADVVSLKDDKQVRNMFQGVLHKTFSLCESAKAFLQSGLPWNKPQEGRKPKLEGSYMLIV